MKLEKYRHIIIMKTLLEAKEPLTAAYLATASKSSIRTVKNDIVYLNGLCKKEKALRIDSYKAKGYKINIINEERYRKVLEDVTVLFSLFYGRSVEALNRRMYILQRFLTDEHVKIEDLSEELYISRSSIRKDIAWANRFLKSYHIELLSTSDGYHVEGKEQDLRSAMVELRCNQYHEFQPLYPYEPFDEMFQKDGVNHYQGLRQAFLSILRSSRISISDIEAKKIPSHICLLYNRIDKNPELDEQIREELYETYDYEIARKIAEDPVIKEYVQFTEIEILNLARLLMINRDLNLRVNGDRDLPEKLVRENRMILEEIIEELVETSGIEIFTTDLFRLFIRDFESLQLQLYLKHHFDHAGKMRFVTYIEGDDNLFSPIPLELTRLMISRLQRKLNEQISDATVMGYVGVFERLLKKIIYPYKKFRIITYSSKGLVYSRHIADDMLERYGSYIEKIDVCNLYEMRSINFDDYDVLLHSGNILYYVYPLPTVEYLELDYSQRGGHLYEQLFRYGFDRSELQIVKKQMNIYPDERIRDIDSFVEALSYRYGKDRDCQQKIYRRFTENERIIDHYYSRNGIMILFTSFALTSKEFIDVYLPEQNVYYDEGQDVKAIIAVCLDPKTSLADIKVFDHILRYIVQVDKALDELIRDKDETLDKIFDVIIRRKFTSL